MPLRFAILLCLLSGLAFCADPPAPTYSSLKWKYARGRCELAFEAMADRLTGNKARYIGHSDGRRQYEDRLSHATDFSWDKSNFDDVVTKQGLYAPAVLYLAHHTRKSPAAVAEELEFLRHAPPEVKTALYFVNVTYPQNFASPFISTSTRSKMAAAYGPFPGNLLTEGLQLSSGPPALPGKSAYFAVRSTPDELNVKKTGSKDANIRSLGVMMSAVSGRTVWDHIQYKYNGVKPKDLAQLEQRAVEVRKWLAEHNYLADLTRAGLEKEALGSPATDRVLEWWKDSLLNPLINIDAERKESGWIDKEHDQWFHIPPENIIRARLYDEQGNVVREK